MKKTLPLLFIVMLFTITVKAQLTESFDGFFPPAGWTNVHTTGPDAIAVWSGAGAGAFLGDDVNGVPGVTINPHSGTGMASFSSYDFDAGNRADLISSAINLSTGGPHVVKFWMYRDDVYTNLDSISVYINTTATRTGASFLGKIIRKRSFSPGEAVDGWHEYAFNIPSGFNSASNYIIFTAVSSFGNNMFIDDVTVSSQPSCVKPTSITVSNYNYANGTATITWPAVGGSPGGYEWTINTTGTAPASGTPVTGITSNISGISPNVVNYVFVRTSCGAGVYSDWTSVFFAAAPCATLTAPLAGATNVPQSQSFSWQAVSGATSYNFYLGTTATNLFNIGSTAGTSVSLSDLIPFQQYFWYVVPVINGVAAFPGSCTAQSFTVGQEATTPTNNPCSGAIVINSTGTVTSTTVGATISLPPDLCGTDPGSSPDDDVWFQFTTGPSTPAGKIVITPSATGGIFDIVAQVYAATSCNALGAPVACADATLEELPEEIDLTQLAPNTHYFIRVYSYSDDPGDVGGFTITASVGNTLPVNMTAFAARRSNSVNILTWSTEQELNTSHFIIERSSDGRYFNPIGRVAAAGSSNTFRQYTFTDDHPGKGDNYYRLRTVDKDNAAVLSGTRRVRNVGIADVGIYPNPVSNQLNLSINTDKKTAGQLIIHDVSGKVVYAKNVQLLQGTQVIPVDMSEISAGTYIIKIQLADDVIIRKFSKQ